MVECEASVKRFDCLPLQRRQHTQRVRVALMDSTVSLRLHLMPFSVICPSIPR